MALRRAPVSGRSARRPRYGLSPGPVAAATGMMWPVRRPTVALAGLVLLASALVTGVAAAGPAAGNTAAPAVRTVLGPGELDGPGGIARSAGGNLFVADTGHCRVLVVPARTGVLDGLRVRAGHASTLVGGGCAGPGSLGHPSDVAGKKHCALTSRVAATDQNDLFAGAQARFDLRRPIPDAAPLEPRDIGNRRVAITRAAGDHNRARLNALAALRLQRERAVDACAVERLDGDRNHHIGAEFLCLNEGAGGKRLAAYSGRKAKVIFDPRACARLAAESPSVENRNRQAFGAGVDCGREACGPRAYHRDVIDKIRAPRGRHTDPTREDLLGRIAEHRAVWTDHQRQSARDIGIVADHLFGLGVSGRIEQVVRIAIPGEKALNPDYVRGAGRADQDGAGGATLKQGHSSEDERAHDALAELRFGDQQRAQTLGGNEQALDIAPCCAVGDRRAPRKLTGLAREVTCALFDHWRHMAQAVALDDRHEALEHDEHAGAELSSLEQLLPVGVVAQRSIAPQSVDFARSQRRKCFLVARSVSGVDEFVHTSRPFAPNTSGLARQQDRTRAVKAWIGFAAPQERLKRCAL
jgi:hypothetical protein